MLSNANNGIKSPRRSLLSGCSWGCSAAGPAHGPQARTGGTYIRSPRSCTAPRSRRCSFRSPPRRSDSQSHSRLLASAAFGPEARLHVGTPRSELTSSTLPLLCASTARGRLCAAQPADVCHPSRETHYSRADGCRRRDYLQRNGL